MHSLLLLAALAATTPAELDVSTPALEARVLKELDKPQAIADVFALIRPGLTERQLAAALDRRMVDLGAERPAFDTIVASGPNGAIPHHAGAIARDPLHLGRRGRHRNENLGGDSQGARREGDRRERPDGGVTFQVVGGEAEGQSVFARVGWAVLGQPPKRLPHVATTRPRFEIADHEQERDDHRRVHPTARGVETHVPSERREEQPDGGERGRGAGTPSRPADQAQAALDRRRRRCLSIGRC